MVEEKKKSKDNTIQKIQHVQLRKLRQGASERQRECNVWRNVRDLAVMEKLRLITAEYKIHS